MVIRYETTNNIIIQHKSVCDSNGADLHLERRDIVDLGRTFAGSDSASEGHLGGNSYRP